MSSGNLDKYEYLTGEDLNYKPSTVEQAIFHYSPLSKLLSEWLKEEDKKEGPLKRLKNIEDKNEDQLKAIKDRAKKKKQLNSKDSKTAEFRNSLIYGSKITEILFHIIMYKVSK